MIPGNHPRPENISTAAGSEAVVYIAVPQYGKKQKLLRNTPEGIDIDLSGIGMNSRTAIIAIGIIGIAVAGIIAYKAMKKHKNSR